MPGVWSQNDRQWEETKVTYKLLLLRFNLQQRSQGGRTIRILAGHTSAFSLRSSSASCLRAYSSAVECEYNSELARCGYTFMSFLLFAVVGRSNQPTDCKNRYSREPLALSYASLLQTRGVTPREDQTSERSCGGTTGNSSDHRVLIKSSCSMEVVKEALQPTQVTPCM